MNLDAYPTHQAIDLPLVPAKRGREWHKQIPATGACLPLTIANEAGWWLLNPHEFEVFPWDDGIEVAFADPVPTKPHVKSHFGHNILTVVIPYIFRTPPGWELRIGGPANYFYDDMQPFEGIVETDWHCATATMNWRVRKGADFTVKVGEPLVQVTPLRIEDLERFTPRMLPDMPVGTKVEYKAWQDRREITLRQPAYKHEHGYAQQARRRRLRVNPITMDRDQIV